MLLYINWDGFSYSLYRQARKSAAGTPNLTRMVENGACLQNHFCGIPAITNPMQQTLVSGAWPEKTGNCYLWFDKNTRRAVPTLRLNNCETVAEAALRHGLSCASVHGWYFENRGCVPGDESRPYIRSSLPNFEERVELLLAYLRGEPVPSGDKMITMQKRPDFLSVYADDIDTVCHNGSRLPYQELARAKTSDAWSDNLLYTVRRMDRALGRLLTLPDITVALAADHGGIPYGAAAGSGIGKDGRPHGVELLFAIRDAGVDACLCRGTEDPVPPGASAVLLLLETQAQLYYLKEISSEMKSRVLRGIRALAFIERCLEKEEQQSYGAWENFCDVYITARSPYSFVENPSPEFVGGSHESMADEVMHVFCAFYGKGIRSGIRLNTRTALPDFAPTLCALMGCSGPKDATGRVLWEILDSSGRGKEF